MAFGRLARYHVLGAVSIIAMWLHPSGIPNPRVTFSRYVMITVARYTAARLNAYVIPCNHLVLKYSANTLSVLARHRCVVLHFQVNDNINLLNNPTGCFLSCDAPPPKLA